jgi:hypothetical protein
VFSWFRKRSPRIAAPTLKPRSEQAVSRERVDLSDMSPDVTAYLGQVAYFELAVFESLSRIVSQAPTLALKEGLSLVAGDALATHHALVAELRTLGADPAEAMEPFAASIDRFETLTAGRTWYESLLGVYITAGFLEDFFLCLVGGLPAAVAGRVESLLEGARRNEVILAALREGMAEDSTLASRLALWGRRLVGDTQLVARSALHGSGNRDTDEQRIEPVFTDLIAAHTRRMDELGLTA